MNYSTDLSVVKTELARELGRALDLPEPQLRDLRLRNAVHDAVVALDSTSSADSRRCAYFTSRRPHTSAHYLEGYLRDGRALLEHRVAVDRLRQKAHALQRATMHESAQEALTVVSHCATPLGLNT